MARPGAHILEGNHTQGEPYGSWQGGGAQTQESWDFRDNEGRARGAGVKADSDSPSLVLSTH